MFTSDVRVRVRSQESDRLLRRLGMIQLSNNYTILTSAFILGGTILFVNGYVKIAIAVILIAIAPAFALFRLLRRIDRLDRMF